MKTLSADDKFYTQGFKLSDYENSKQTGLPITLQVMTVERDLPLSPKVTTQQPRITTEQSKISSFIIGGSSARRGEFPEFTQLLFSNGVDVFVICGATLIAPNKVLTAAHCVNSPRTGYFAVPNFYSFNDNLTASDVYRVTRVVVHPNYRSSRFDYDIAVLTLERNSPTSIAAVYVGDNKLVGKRGTVIGTGITSSFSQSTPSTLRKVAAPILSNGQCNNNFQRLAGIRPATNRVICAGFLTNGRGSCNGDSGGPLWLNIKNRRTVVGTVSFGLATCEAQRGTSAYARTSALRGFIRAQSPSSPFISEKVNTASLLPLLLN